MLVRSQRPFWGSGYFETMLWTVMLYAVLLALSSYHEFADWLRERETATARLRAEIAEAELTSSAMRFDPENVLARTAGLKSSLMSIWESPSGSLVRQYNELKLTMPKAVADANALLARATSVSQALKKYDITLTVPPAVK
jgi:hypothetical protein